MESQKIKNLLDHKDGDDLKYQTEKWYNINDRNNGQYDEGDGNDKPIKIDTEVVKPFLYDYADAYILVTGDIAVVGGDGNTKVAFNNCHPFIKSEINLSDEHVESADNLDLMMNKYNLIEYSDNYSDSTASLYHYKRQEQSYDAEKSKDIVDLTDNSSSFKYKSDLLGTTETQIPTGGNRNNPEAHRLWKMLKLYFH